MGRDIGIDIVKRESDEEFDVHEIGIDLIELKKKTSRRGENSRENSRESSRKSTTKKSRKCCRYFKVHSGFTDCKQSKSE